MQTKRLFFALLPERGIREQLIETSKLFPTVKGVRPIPNDNLHVTLLFLGNIDENAYKCLEKKVFQTYIQPFTLRLNLYGYFKIPQLTWLGTSSCPTELKRLVNHLKSIALQCGIELDTRPYKPHVTLFRKVQKAEFPDKLFDITWKVKEFHLLESISHENTTIYNKLVTYQLSED